MEAPTRESLPYVSGLRMVGVVRKALVSSDLAEAAAKEPT
jgi:hypothetical protein